jgi:hypothetical protein
MISLGTMAEAAIGINRQVSLADLYRAADELPKYVVGKDAREMYVELAGALITPTPVKDGRARGGWQLGINSTLPQSVKHAIDKTPAGGMSSEDTAEIMALTANNVEIETNMWIVNNVHYIGGLAENPGNSQQAPQGWLDLTIENLKIGWDLSER